MSKEHNAIILTTPKDFIRLQNNYPRMIQMLAPRKVIFIGSVEVGNLVENSEIREKVGYINEDDVIPFDAVHSVMKNALQVEELGRGVTGWYYQQFLKMQYSFQCKDDYYLVWDGDTVPCKQFSMFKAGTDIPYLDLKHEYHEDYFKTIDKLFPGMHKVIEQSFISEHMLMNCKIMRELIAQIELNDSLKGNKFYEKVIYAITPDKLVSNSFSEFETYGTYVAYKHLNTYRLREWHSFRYGGEFFHPERMTDEDYRWLSVDFDAISFEKGHFVREDHENLFSNKEYQEKISAKQMLEIAQETFQDGMIEVWTDRM